MPLRKEGETEEKMEEGGEGLGANAAGGLGWGGGGGDGTLRAPTELETLG